MWSVVTKETQNKRWEKLLGEQQLQWKDEKEIHILTIYKVHKYHKSELKRARSGRGVRCGVISKTGPLDFVRNNDNNNGACIYQDNVMQNSKHKHARKTIFSGNKVNAYISWHVGISRFSALWEKIVIYGKNKLSNAWTWRTTWGRFESVCREIKSPRLERRSSRWMHATTSDLRV